VDDSSTPAYRERMALLRSQEPPRDAVGVLGQGMSLVALALLLVTAGAHLAAGLTYQVAILCFCASLAMLALPMFGGDAYRVGATGICWLCVAALLFGLAFGWFIWVVNDAHDAAALTQLVCATGLFVLGAGSACCTLSEQLPGRQRAMSFVLLACAVVSFEALLYSGSGGPVFVTVIASLFAVLIWAALDWVRDRPGQGGPVWLATGVCVLWLTLVLLLAARTGGGG
jgi:hypothetical protein